MRSTAGRVILTAVAAGVGWVVGYVVAMFPHVVPRQVNYPFLAEQIPLPHHVPRYRDGLSFRFAMVNDVVHERFPRHGPEHYQERNRVTRETLAKLAPDDPARFPLDDDLAAGLERLGKSDEAVAVMRRKLELQRAKGVAGRALYTSYANLGTFLIHGAFRQAMAGDRAARERFREGVGLIRESVKVNPEAHFGREQWQAVTGEYLLAALDDPGLLRTFDCLGNRLDLPIEAALDRETNWTTTGHGRPYDAAFAREDVDSEVPDFFRTGVRPDDPSLWPKLSLVRKHITKVGAETDWEKVPVPSHRAPVPFDEPAMGLIGMWREGGGANPYFALALGETMLRVGQRYLAWSAFERAGRLADRYWPDPSLQQFLRDHCAKRQAEIEGSLRYPVTSDGIHTAWQNISPPPPHEVIAGLRKHFDEELAFGEGYRRDYQAYEAAKLAEGVPVGELEPDAAFTARHGPVASPTGPEEWFVRVPRARINAYAEGRSRAWALFGAGAAAAATALLCPRPRPAKRPDPADSLA